MSRTTSALSRQAVLGIASKSSLGGELTVREGDRTYIIGPGGTPKATMVIESPLAWPMLWTRTGIIESYLAGYWDSPDLAAVFSLAARSVATFDRLRSRFAFVRVPWLRLRSGLVRTSHERSRRDSAMHYELGNDLFGHILGPMMMYSCAFFEHEGSSLEEAALAKLEMVCDKLALGPDDRVLEIGSGWGGFAIHAASTRGCHVTTTTVSQMQYELAVERVREAGLEHLIDVRRNDYRELEGQYDKVASIEMIEAVGHRDLGTYFACCSELLKPDGLMLLQAITIDDRAYDVAKFTRSFIQTYVFPSSCVPSKSAIAESIAHQTDLRTVHLEDLSGHYVATLQGWRANLDGAGDELEALGYDERLRRFLRLYLAYSQAGFESGRTSLVQMLLAKPERRLKLLGARWARC